MMNKIKIIVGVLAFIFLCATVNAQFVGGRVKRVAHIPKYYDRETFFTLNCAYAPSPQLSYGFSVGRVKRFGWYLNLMSNYQYKGITTKTECNDDGYVDGVMPFYSGKMSKIRFSGMAGPVFKIIQPLSLYLGVGYGYRALNWETDDGNWIKNVDYSYSGFNGEIGALFNINGFVITAGVSTINFKYMEFKIGIGGSFK